MTVPTLYTLSEASKQLLAGRVSRRTLAEEIRAGRLEASYLGGRYLVTESAVADLLNRRKVQPGGDRCRDDASLRGSGSGGREETATPSGSSSTEENRLRQAAARASLAALKKRSPTTSHKATVHRLPASSGNSTSKT